jgi:hypothetical protein
MLKWIAVGPWKLGNQKWGIERITSNNSTATGISWYFGVWCQIPSGNYENKLERLALEINQIQVVKWTESVPEGRGLSESTQRGRNGRDEDLGLWPIGHGHQTLLQVLCPVFGDGREVGSWKILKNIERLSKDIERH